MFISARMVPATVVKGDRKNRSSGLLSESRFFYLFHFFCCVCAQKAGREKELTQNKISNGEVGVLAMDLFVFE